MRTLLPLLLISLLAAPPGAAAASASKPGADDLLKKTFPEKGVQALHKRGFLSLTNGQRGGGITHVQWPLMKRFRQAAPAYRSFLTVYKKNRKSLSVEGSLEDLRTLQSLPIGGLMTPSVRAAVDVLASLLNDAGALDKRLSAAPEGNNLFEAKWGRDFVETRNAALLFSPQEQAPAFFRDVLSQQDSTASRSAVLDFIKAVYQTDIAEALDADLSKAKLSPEVQDRLATYLADQRLLWTVSETRSRLRDIERTGTLVHDASDLEFVLAGFEKNPELEKELLAALESKPAPDDSNPQVRFSGPELHVHSDDGSPSLDTGDTAVISIAFWVYGVKDGQEIEVSQLTFVDRGPSGISNRTETKVRLKNGGPYSFSIKIPLLSDESFTFRLFLKSPGAEDFIREIEIQPSPRYREILSIAAEADREAASCMLSDALNRYDAAIEALTPLAGKARFDDLLDSIQARRRKAQHQADAYENLQGAIDGTKLFASKDQCTFHDDRARRALSLLSELPAGCGAMPEGPSGHSLAEELRSLTRATQRGAEAQEAFRRAVKKGRDLESRCRTEEATAMYAGALALLDGEPNARCGAWEEEYSLVRIEDLPRAAGATRLAQAFAEVADDAEKRLTKGDAAGALQLLLPALAKIDAMRDADCYDSSRRRITQLTQAYGVALSPGSPSKTAEAAKLPKDSPERAIETVLKEKQRRRKKRQAARAAETQRQAPDTAASNGAPQ